jgi:hypothetical protein
LYVQKELPGEVSTDLLMTMLRRLEHAAQVSLTRDSASTPQLLERTQPAYVRPLWLDPMKWPSTISSENFSFSNVSTSSGLKQPKQGRRVSRV